MSSPKGTSKHPQSAMYKDGECKVVEQSEVEALIADGWYDNPDENATATAEVTDDSETAPDEETDPAVDETADEDSGDDEAE